MFDVGKVVNIIVYCGPQTYEDFKLQGFRGSKEQLDELVSKGILKKQGDTYYLKEIK